MGARFGNKTRGKQYLTGDIELLGDIVKAGGDASSSLLRVSRASVTYEDTTATELFDLPANAILVALYVDVQTAFNDGTAAVLDIGNGTTANAYINDLDVSSTGQTATGWSNLGSVGTSPITMQATYTGTNEDADAGEALVYALWINAL